MVVDTAREQFVGNIAIGHRPLVSRVRFQLLGGLLIGAALPVIIRGPVDARFFSTESLYIAGFGSAAAVTLGFYLTRRIGFFPGVQSGARILFGISAAFALVALVLLLLHLPYSRFVFATAYVSALLWFLGVHMVSRRVVHPQLAVVAGGNAEGLTELTGPQWLVLRTPPKRLDDVSAVVADLRHELSEEWGRFLADCTLRGVPVFHSKQVKESLTGKVEIEHLSENNFGSLLPNLAYLKVKQSIDWVATLLLLPIFLIALVIVAPLILLESGWPVFYRQERVGYRGQRFMLYKFRTMRPLAPGQGDTCDRDAAMTRDGDERVTRIGRILRTYRIDELPQVLNILKGEMSWIGPRPEAVPLSGWYEAELPFYRYRHVVRPGISGWAQVNQGHVALPHEVQEKLHYDFFYIKYLSPWLDLLIVIRTMATVLRGFGAK